MNVINMNVKKNIVSFLLLLVSFNLTFAQEFKVEYKVQYKYTHHSNLNDLENSNSESLYLFTGENQSLFVNHNIAYEEEIEKELDRMKRRGGTISYDKAGQIRSYFPSQYYKNFERQEVLVLRSLGLDKVAYFEPRVPLEWTILEQEPEEYLGYSVQAATTDFAGRSYTAWFTTEIPISDGPHVFYGLPGLIVDVYDTEKHFRFYLEGIEKPETDIYRKLPKYKEIQDAKEYIQLYANDRKQAEIITTEGIRSGKIQMGNDSGGVMSVEEYLIWNRKRNSREHINEMELE